MASDNESLHIRIVPELDKGAVKSVEDQLNAISPKVPIGGAGGGSVTPEIKAQTAALKELIREQKTAIEIADLKLRKTRSAAEQEIALIREAAAANRISMSEMSDRIMRQEAIIENANTEAIVSYGQVRNQVDLLTQEYQQLGDVTTRLSTQVLQKLNYANERLVSGFNSMSGSMGQITSQTKATNLAFMNFGRIIQDLPFGLIGIANNIDPMLVSFDNLKNEIDSTTGRVRGFGGAIGALGKQLLGPAGLIFLLGSALPSALLFLKSRQRETKEEADLLADAFKKVADEFGKLAGQAAKGRGIAQVNAELDTTVKTLDAVRNEQKKINAEIEEQASIQARSLTSGQDYAAVRNELIKSARQQRALELEQLDIAIQSLEANEKSLNTAKAEITAEGVTARIQRENGIAASLSLEEQYKLRKRLTELEIESLEITDKAQAELLRKQEELRWRMVDLIKDTMSLLRVI